jgi:plasmid stabilization system protein ParE
MAKVIWTQCATGDLSQIFDYLAKSSQSADLAERICNELLNASYDRLTKWPDSGSLVPEGREFGLRELFKHSYRIIYAHRGDACYVVRCIHSSRDLARQLDPLRWPRVVWESPDE